MVFKKIGKAFLAAITSPDAVQREKSLAAFVVVRLLLALGASTALVEFVQQFV